MAKFCQNCGSPIKEGAVFCFSCGAKLPEKETPVAPVAEPEPEVVISPEPVAEVVEPEVTEPVTLSEPEVQNFAPASEPFVMPEPAAEQYERPTQFTDYTNNTVAEPVAQPASKAVKPKKHRVGFWVKLVISLLIIAAIAAGVVYCVMNHMNASDEIRATVDDYVEAVYLGNEEALEKLFPEKFSAALHDELKDAGFGDVTDDVYDARLTSMSEQFGDNISVTYKITDLEFVPCFNEYYYVDMVEKNHDIANIDFDTVYRVRFDVKIKGDSGSETYSYKVIAVELDGDWYLFDLNKYAFSYVDAYIEWLDIDASMHDDEVELY